MEDMKTLHFSILIDAPKEKVWDTVIGKATYPQWAETFGPGGDMQGSWEQGSKVLFRSLNEKGKHDGMVSEIAENKPHEFLSIRHIGFLKDDVEDTDSPEVKAWAPAYENYTLKDFGSGTEFSVDLDTVDEFAEYFNNSWPKALKALKEIVEKGESSLITVGAFVKAPIEKVWEYYNSPEHITKWAFASNDWEAPHAENDLRVGGKFVTTMAAKDGSEKFDFTGEYTQVKEHELIEYKMDDGREVSVRFMPGEESVFVIITFAMEHENPREMQREGWQAIFNNFKKHVEQA